MEKEIKKLLRNVAIYFCGPIKWQMWGGYEMHTRTYSKLWPWNRGCCGQDAPGGRRKWAIFQQNVGDFTHGSRGLKGNHRRRTNRFPCFPRNGVSSYSHRRFLANRAFYFYIFVDEYRAVERVFRCKAALAQRFKPPTARNYRRISPARIIIR